MEKITRCPLFWTPAFHSRHLWTGPVEKQSCRLQKKNSFSTASTAVPNSNSAQQRKRDAIDDGVEYFVEILSNEEGFIAIKFQQRYVMKFILIIFGAEGHLQELAMFNGVDFLTKFKGIRLMFVGDSLSLNQWQSLTCMLHVAVPEANYTLKRTNGLSTFTFPTYNASFMFFRNAFLVDIASEPTGKVLKLDSISTNKVWDGMDVVIFDSWHWWLHTGRKQPWDTIHYGNTTVKEMDRLSLYEKALNTWAKWVDSHVDPKKTKVFFQGISPDHASMPYINAMNCQNQTQPLKNPGDHHPAELVLEKVLKAMCKPVYLLNITTLSQLRIDGHPASAGRGVDCTHWCLAGVPDTWNQLLYTILFSYLK